MIELAKIKSIAQSYSPQELFAALVWQRQFNNFNGEEVITDLSKRSDLWASFLFTRPIFTSDKNGLSFNGVIDTLLAMANYRPVPPESIIHYVPYPADTLYVLTYNQDTVVSQLMDLGKKWQADSVEVIDSNHSDCGWRLKHRLMLEFGDRPSRQTTVSKKASLEELSRDAVIVAYWWD